MNYIEKIENMNLPKLESLNLTGNQIINLENLEGLINLKELDISKNKIDKLDYLSTDGVCNDLLILKCNYSNIEFQYLGKLVGVLQNLIYLEEIEFIGNQITLNSEYKCIFSKVLTLKSIDGVQISNTQKQHLKVKFIKISYILSINFY